MYSLAIQEVLDKLPAKELDHSLEEFSAPFRHLIPDKRLASVIIFIISGIVCAQSPVVARIAAIISRNISNPHAAAARIYRLLDNPRLCVPIFRTILDTLVITNLARENPTRVVVAIDPVNFEKPYTKKLPGVSHVHKATPPTLSDGARIARGYPAITATIVNTRIPTTTYANWFSYELDFVSQNQEIKGAIEHTTTLLTGRTPRFVCDAAFDDQKMFAHFAKTKAEFIARVSHYDRLVEVYNERRGVWEPEKLEDIVAVIDVQGKWRVSHNHARQTTEVDVAVGWSKIRLPNAPEQELWVLIMEDINKTTYRRPLLLMTNVAIISAINAQQVYEDWRLRTRIEDGYRFDQEQGLDVEDMRLQSLEGMCKMFMLVLLSAQFVFYLLDTWPPKAILWIRELGGKQGLKNDCDGVYIFLWGLVALLKTFVTLSHLSLNPFPHDDFPRVQRCV